SSSSRPALSERRNEEPPRPLLPWVGEKGAGGVRGTPSSGRGDAGHLAARLGAGAARLGATPAVIVVVLFALDGAGVAGVGAEPAHLVDEARAAAHEGGGQPAQRGAVTVQADALGQVGHVGLAQAGVGAVVALLSAAGAGLDARMASMMT